MPHTKHASIVSRSKIEALKAEGDAKAKLLTDATQLQEQQAALMDRVQAVVEELRKKGGEVDVYDENTLPQNGFRLDFPEHFCIGPNFDSNRMFKDGS